MIDQIKAKLIKALTTEEHQYLEDSIEIRQKSNIEETNIEKWKIGTF